MSGVSPTFTVIAGAACHNQRRQKKQKNQLKQSGQKNSNKTPHEQELATGSGSKTNSCHIA
ncbi:uncharacterized protein Dana_GF28024 [Drosophila ananassae]|uniref:Uncharacterized protein n=1 Tax=Drosophila ananassae TaxID=7217 RepID=A0A0P8ZR46_DROAN|nr:uncharacterized protein Dana_GF28024 [Drosophila ananassae]